MNIITECSSGFTSINEELFLQACTLGRNEALSLLIIAAGTNGKSTRSSWSAQAVSTRLKIDWKYAKHAIQRLEEAGIITDTKKEANKGKSRTSPKYVINAQSENDIWYPLSLFDEFINASTGEVFDSPIVRLKEANDINLIRFIMYLYKHHDLQNEAGIPRGIIHSKQTINTLGTWQGKWDICSYTTGDKITTEIHQHPRYQDAIYKTIDSNISPCHDGKNWIFFLMSQAEELGFIESAIYLFEGSEYGTSYLFPIKGIPEEMVITEELSNYFIKILDSKNIPNESRDEPLGTIEEYIDDEKELFHKSSITHQNAQVYEVYRLRFRPHTAPTGEWYAQIQAKSEAHVRKICG